MNRNLLIAGLFMLISVGVSAQTGFDNTSNIISIDSARTKRTAIKIYPNPSYGKLSVTATTMSSLHFYVFDVEGTLVFQAVLHNKERSTIDNLKKGTYMYDVFEQDESIESGKIIIK